MALQPNKKSAGKLTAEKNLTSVEARLLTTLPTKFS
jgi:hypothetical protein